MRETTSEEHRVWEGSPSQWLNFGTYLLSGLGLLVILAGGFLAWRLVVSQEQAVRLVVLAILAGLAAIPVLVALKSYLDIRFTRYTVTTERIGITRGILSRETHNMELYRVDDILLVQPFLLRLVGRGNVVLMTSDRSTPTVVVEAIPNPETLRDQVRKHVESCRDRKRTRVLDMQ